MIKYEIPNTEKIITTHQGSDLVKTFSIPGTKRYYYLYMVNEDVENVYFELIFSDLDTYGKRYYSINKFEPSKNLILDVIHCIEFFENARDIILLE